MAFPLPNPEFDTVKAEALISILSERQKAILAWMAEGKTNQEIGKIIGFSKATVENEVTAILNYLQVENRLVAAAIYLQWRTIRNGR